MAQTDNNVQAEPAPQTRQPDLDIGAIATVGAVGTLVVILAVMLLQAYYFNVQSDASAEANQQPVIEVQKLRAEQLEKLGGNSIAATPKGTIQIPIDRAIEIVAREGAVPPWPTGVTAAVPASPAGNSPAGAAAPTPGPGGAGQPAAGPSAKGASPPPAAPPARTPAK